MHYSACFIHVFTDSSRTKIFEVLEQICSTDTTLDHFINLTLAVLDLYTTGGVLS